MFIPPWDPLTIPRKLVTNPGVAVAITGKIKISVKT